LGNVIACLITSKAEYVPYKDSKLTRVLQDSLGGSNKTTLIVNCSPHIYHTEDSITSLKFATRAKKIKNRVKLNENIKNHHLEDIISNLRNQLKHSKDQIELLKTMLKKTKTKLHKCDGGNNNSKYTIDINGSKISSVFEDEEYENEKDLDKELDKDNEILLNNEPKLELLVERNCTDPDCKLYIESLLKQIDILKKKIKKHVNYMLFILE